jgi:hypothetical protein
MLTQEIFAEWICDHCFAARNQPVLKFIFFGQNPPEAAQQPRF